MSEVNDSMLNDILSALDFTEEESKTYVSLLEGGPMAAGHLAKRIGAPRPSTYGFLKKLTDRGAVTQSLKEGVKIFMAERPEVITKLFREEIDKLESKRHQFENMIPDLEELISGDFFDPRFEFFEGAEGVQNVLKDILLYSGIETRAYWPIQATIETLSGEFFHYHNMTRIQNKTSIKAIWPRNQIIDIKEYPALGTGKEYLREIRIAPPEIAFSMGYWIYKNKVAFLSSRRENFGFIIESQEMAEMMTSQHEMIWQSSKPLDVDPSDMAPFVNELKKKERSY